MRYRIVPGLVALALIAGTSSPARAEFNLAIGLKWTPLRYTTPVRGTAAVMPGQAGLPDNSAFGSSGLSPNASDGASGSSFQSTALSNYIGFFPIEQLGLLVSFDLGYGSFHHDDLNNVMMTPVDDNWSFVQGGFSVGGKFYLIKPAEKKVVPYIYLDIYKLWASITTSEKVVTNEQLGAIAGLRAPLGFDLAFGAEYFLSSGFSLGAEVLGLRYSYVEGDFVDTAMTKHTEKDQAFTLYAGISLNYRFKIGGARVATEEEEERKRPAVRRPRPVRPVPEEEPSPPPARPAPVPSPESVD